MDTFETIRTVLAVRDYQDKPIPADVLDQIVRAAHLTASSKNGQPWHFIVVRDKATLHKLAQVATTGRYLAQAPVAIVVVIDPDSIFGVSDGSRAIQDMILTAWSHGIGSNWVGWEGRLTGAKFLLGIPEHLDVLAILPFGYPANERLGKGHKKRKPVGEVVFDERFGTPFPPPQSSTEDQG